jgi:DNA-binding transcriptional LysR family regulator
MTGTFARRPADAFERKFHLALQHELLCTAAMELRTLRAFTEVVRRGGFSQAARAVYATQSTVSKAVKQLEDELGTRLLDRLGHGVALTAAGEIVHRRALAMLAERDDLMAELDELRGLKRGKLRLGLPPLGSSQLFAPLFAAFRARYPGIEIRLVEHGSGRLESLLLDGEIDLAASLLPVAESFEFQPVTPAPEPLLALLPPGHPAAGRAAAGLADLAAGTPLVLYEEGFALNRLILEACRRRGLEPVVAARSGQIDFIVELVAAGLGVAFLPRMMAEPRLRPDLAAVTLAEPGTAWHMALIWRRGGYLPEAARAWLELARYAGWKPPPTGG